MNVASQSRESKRSQNHSLSILQIALGVLVGLENGKKFLIKKVEQQHPDPACEWYMTGNLFKA